MYINYRSDLQTPIRWAKDLGYDNYKKILSEKYLLSFYKRTIKDERWLAIRKYIRPGSTIVDCGCGMGQWVWFLNKLGYKSIGVDYSKEMIDILKKYLPQYNWVHSDIRNIPLESETVDAIISWGVIEHFIEGPNKALREFNRLLKPGGYIFISVPLDSKYTRMSNRIEFGNIKGGVFFQYYFREEEIKKILQSELFSIFEIRKFYKSYPIILPWVYKMAKKNRYLLGISYRLLQPMAKLFDSSYSMIFCIAQKT